MWIKMMAILKHAISFEGEDEIESILANMPIEET